MQDDHFLNEYRQAWQQDSEAIEKSLDNISLETLHANIARHQQRRRRALWLTVSAAACLALVLGLGLRLMNPSTTENIPPLVAQNNTPEAVPATPQTTAPEVPTTPTLEATTTAAQSLPTHTKEVPRFHPLPDIALARPDSMPPALPAAPSQPEPSTSTTNETATPQTSNSAQNKPAYRIIETQRLVAMGPNTKKTSQTSVTETQQLVKIEEPSRNTFREAVIEPLLALMTNNLSD